MTGQVFTETMTCYRIGDPDGEFPIFSHIGSTLREGRWHKTGTPMIYTSQHYSTAMLEVLAHFSGDPPPRQHFVQVTIPKGASYEMFDTTAIPDWFKVGNARTRDFGAQWQREKRSLILIVPSAIAHIEQNFLINPFHEAFGDVRAGLHHPIYWDTRLFTI